MPTDSERLIRARSLDDVAKKSDVIASRVRAMRERLQLTQEEVAQRGGFPHRTYVAKIESGANQAGSYAARQKLAKGLGITLPQVDALIDTRMPLDEVLELADAAGAALPSPVPSVSGSAPSEGEVDSMAATARLEHMRAVGTRFPRLEAALAFYESRWSRWTIAAAAAGIFGEEDVAPPEWAERLDRLEAILRHAVVTGSAPKILPAKPS